MLGSEAGKSCDEVTLDVGGAAVDEAPGGVAEISLDLMFAEVTFRSVDANGIEARSGEGLGDGELAHAGLEGNRVACVLQAGGLVEKESAGFEAKTHLGDPMGDTLERSDGLAELLTLL